MTPQSNSWQDWLTPGRFAFLLGAMIFAAFPQVALGFHTFVYRDFGLFGYPVAYHHRESLWSGEIPLWNPYSNFGIPFLAQWGTMALYPPSLIYLLLPLPWSAGFFCLVHLFFGGMGMYTLARRWTNNSFAAGLAGVAFAFNGLTLNCLMWLNYTASVAWMPWVVWAVMGACREGRRRIVYAAAFGALQMLSGTPEVILITWALAFGLCACETAGSWKEIRLTALRLAAVVILVALLSAPQLLPFLQLLGHSSRSSSFAHGQWSIAVWGWANFFVPLFRTYRTGSGVHFQEIQGFTHSYYPGLAFIALALIALFLLRRERRVWFLWLAVVSSVLLAMGKDGPIYEVARKVFPPLGFMRYPSKFLLVTMFAWPLLAAFGWIAILQSQRSNRWRGELATVIVIGTLVAGVVAFAWLRPFPGEEWNLTFRNGLERLLLLGGVSALIFWALRSRRMTPPGIIAILLVAWFDFLRHMPAQNPTAVPHAFTASLPHLEQLRPRPRLGESRALLTLEAMQRFHTPGSSNLTETYLVLRSGLYDNCNLIDRVPKADGFFALYLKEERDIHYRLYEADDRPREPLARFLGVSQVSGRSNVLAWESRTNYLPLISAGQQPVFAGREATLAGLVATNFAGDRIVYLPPEAQVEVSIAKPNAARVRVTRVSHHTVQAEVEADAPSLVVMSQAYYPAWRAELNGKATRIWRANHAFQALYVPTGRHIIRWVYRDTAFWAGVLISAITLGSCGTVLLASRRCTRPVLNRDKESEVTGQPAPISSGLVG